MYHGYGSHREEHVHQEEQPPPPPGIPPAPVVDEGGEVNVPLKKQEEDEVVPYGGAPEPEAKPEEKPEEEQEAVPHGGAPEPMKPVRTPVAILGSLGVCIYVPASRHWLISYSPIHLT